MLGEALHAGEPEPGRLPGMGVHRHHLGEELVQEHVPGQELEDRQGHEDEQPPEEAGEEVPVVGGVADHHPPDQVAAEDGHRLVDHVDRPAGAVVVVDRHAHPEDVEDHEEVDRHDPVARIVAEAQEERHEEGDLQRVVGRHADRADARLDRDHQRQEEERDEERGAHAGDAGAGGLLGARRGEATPLRTPERRSLGHLGCSTYHLRDPDRWRARSGTQSPAGQRAACRACASKSHGAIP